MTIRRLAATFLRPVLATMLSVATLSVASGPVASGATSPTCRSNQLRIAFASGGVGLGHVALLIRYTNVSPRACALSGYPRIALHNAAGTTTLYARRTQNGYLGGLGQTATPRANPVVTLNALTGVASTMMEGTDVPEGSATSCLTLTKLDLTLPGKKLGFHFLTKFPACSVPEVHPFVKGPSGDMH